MLKSFLWRGFKKSYHATVAGIPSVCVIDPGVSTVFGISAVAGDSAAVNIRDFPVVPADAVDYDVLLAAWSSLLMLACEPSVVGPTVAHFNTVCGVPVQLN
jgi:hypothetical protein